MKAEMKIDEYVKRNELNVRLAMVPPSLMQQFKIEDDVEYLGNKGHSCIAGMCKKHGFFAVWKESKGITNGKVDKDYPTLDSW